MLIATSVLLKQATDNQYALGAFNVYNLEGIKAVINAAEAEQSPVILQIHPKILGYGGTPFITLCLKAGEVSSIPVAVHLDHSSSQDEIKLGLHAGMHSIMADGSDLAYEDNVVFTQQMAQYAHVHQATIEGELGKISGIEDGLTVADYEAQMTDPTQALAFVEKTQIDMLAVCIGNVHGPYPSEPQLDFHRLEQIRKNVHIPLVMHGASGLPDSAIQQSILLGICKFNVNTEIRQAYLNVLYHINSGDDLMAIMERGTSAMQAVVRHKLRLFGSSGKASSLSTYDSS